MDSIEKLSIQIDDAFMLARLHRTHAAEVLGDSTIEHNEEARIAATTSMERADTALSIYREAATLFPDYRRATDAKLRGDIVLLEAGTALLTARQALANKQAN